MTPIAESKCTSRPDCPCEFCVKRNVDLAAGLTPGQQLALIAYEWMVDRQMDAEMRDQKRDPAFVEEQRQFVAELLRKFQAATPPARLRRKR
jgi:hypothetical protein